MSYLKNTKLITTSCRPGPMASAIFVLFVGLVLAACGGVPKTGAQSRESAATAPTDLAGVGPAPRQDAQHGDPPAATAPTSTEPADPGPKPVPPAPK